MCNNVYISPGVWGIGVATQKVNLNQVPLGRDTNSLVLRHDGSVYHNNEEKNRLPANSLPQEGDIVVSQMKYQALPIRSLHNTIEFKKYIYIYLVFMCLPNV